jgi:YVTN family beta-propeller protein
VNGVVYVSNQDDGVNVIDTDTNTVIDNIDVGNRPFGLAITPDQAPVAALTITPAPAGQATTFDASASTVEFGTIATFEWDFGDGTTATTTEPTATHTYAIAGSYPVTVTLTSSGGTSTTRVFTGQTIP